MFFILDIMQVAFVTLAIVDLPASSLNPQGTGTKAKRAMLRSTCILRSSCRYLGSKWGGPLAMLGFSRGEAIHA